MVEKYVTINNKKNTPSILLSIIFLHAWSHFIILDFKMKSFPFIVFYFRWRMLVDSTLEFGNKDCGSFYIFLLYIFNTMILQQS